MGVGTKHPKVSGLIVEDGGIAMNNHGISDCTDIGGRNGTINFTNSGIEISTPIYLGDYDNIYIKTGGSGTFKNIYDFIEATIAQYLDSNGVGGSEDFLIEGSGVITQSYRTLTFTNGLLTGMSD